MKTENTPNFSISMLRTTLLPCRLLLILAAILRLACAASENDNLSTEPGVSDFTNFLQLGSRAHIAASNQREALANAAPKPHILFVLLDDLGWADVGFNHARKGKFKRKTVTPTIDALAKDGVVLGRHYVHPVCSPTRSAIQSGRAPIHVNNVNGLPMIYNENDTVAGYAGIPPNMTGIAEVMRSAGYSTHMVGKWDVGMATPQHTPAGKGYDTSLIYFAHEVDSWNHKNRHNNDFFRDTCNKTADILDLWHSDGNTPFPGQPAKLYQNVDGCSFENQHPDGKCVYIDQIFEDRVKDIIKDHNPSKPLFLFWATKTAHAQYQPPDLELANLQNTAGRRTVYGHKRAAVIGWIDGAIERVLQTLKDKKIYDDTLIVLTSDNGAHVNFDENEDTFGLTPKRSPNYPLKAGKFSSWEGGVRVPALVSGGFIPKSVRGTRRDHLVAAWDWYATFTGLAGADPTDAKAAQAGLPPHESVDQWPMISGTNSTAPRTRIEMGRIIRHDHLDTTVTGLITQPYKLLVDDPAPWHFVNSTRRETCGYTPETGCLYDIFADPSEKHNIAKQKPDEFIKLMNELTIVNRTVFSPFRGKIPEPGSPKSVELCNLFVTKYGGFYGPLL